MKIRIIDLLNTPLNKLPKKIKIEDTIYNLLIDEDNLIYYQNEECKYFMYSISCFNELNEEVEIIEEDKKIEKIENLEFRNFSEYENLEIRRLKDTINQLIDAVNQLKGGVDNGNN